MNERQDITSPSPLFPRKVFPIYHRPWLGVVIAHVIILLRLCVLIALLRSHVSDTSWRISAFGVAILAFLYTGLFITGIPSYPGGHLRECGVA